MLYEVFGCRHFEEWRPIPQFEQYSEADDPDLRSKVFMCAVARYLDTPGISESQRFQHLATQALRGERWGAALSEPMARVSFAKYEDFLIRHSKSLQPGVWLKACTMTINDRNWYRPEDVSHWQYSPRVTQLFYDQALHNQNAAVRDCLIAGFDNAATSESQARAFAGRLSIEETPSVRAGILSLQLWHNNPRANNTVREFLRGPIEYDTLHEVCRSYNPTESTFLKASRYDFLQDLKALRARLPGVIAGERDVRRRFQVREAAEKAMNDLDTLIGALEKRKTEDEASVKSRVDGGPPRAP